jgi:hypothetical protein
MKNLSKIFLLGLTFSLWGCSPKVHKSISKLTDNVTEPHYASFNLPQSEISLPSIFVGEENSIENVCFIGDTQTKEMYAPDSLKISISRDTKMRESFQSELKKELVKAGLSSDLASTTSKKISVEIEGIRILKLSNISQVKPDFNNASCNTKALNYYVDDRTIITGALKAEKYKVITTSGMSNEIKAKLDAVINNLDIKLGMAFERAVNASGDFEYTASNVFFGALTTKLAVVECKVEVYKVKIKPDGLFKISKNDICSNFNARFKRSLMSSDFTVEIYPEYNPQIGSGEIDVREGKVTDIRINDVALASVTIDQLPNSDKFNIDLSIKIVGIDAEQIVK